MIEESQKGPITTLLGAKHVQKHILGSNALAMVQASVDGFGGCSTVQCLKRMPQESEGLLKRLGSVAVVRTPTLHCQL